MVYRTSQLSMTRHHHPGTGNSSLLILLLVFFSKKKKKQKQKEVGNYSLVPYLSFFHENFS